MTAVANNDHFPDAASKQNAVELISQAQLATLDALSDSTELNNNIYEVAADLASDTEQSGLSGSDLQTAIEYQGKGIAKGLIDKVDSSKHEEVINFFSKGAVEGVLNNPNLSSSGTDLIGALTEGLLGEVGNENGGKLTGEGKGLIIKEILSGVKSQVSQRSDFDDTGKDNFISGIWDSATSAIIGVGNSTVASTIQENLFSSNSEIHAVSIYQAGSSSVLVPGSTSGTFVWAHIDKPATVNISAGNNKPIILVLTSYEGVNWHLTGATSRVEKVILHGYYDQTVDIVDPSKVEMYSYESNNGYFYNIKNGGWFYHFAEPWTQALLVKIRQQTGAKVASYQGVYDQTSFTVGDGSNIAGQLAGLSLVRPWLYCSNYDMIKGYQMSGPPNIYTTFYLTKPLAAAASVRVWVENTTTTNSDIPAFDHTYTINAGVSTLQVFIPFNQSNLITATKLFKVHVEASDSLFNFQKVINAEIIGGSGVNYAPAAGGTTTYGGLMQL